VENIKVSNAILSCISVCFSVRTWSALVCLVLAFVICVNGGNMSTIHHFISQFYFHIVPISECTKIEALM
jgi:hypothetical protein